MELQQLAEELNIRDARKLYQAAARREYRGVSLQQDREALKGDVARQVLAPKPRSLGKSGASAPDKILQSDSSTSAKTRGLAAQTRTMHCSSLMFILVNSKPCL